MKTIRSHFKREYIRVLSNGLSSEEDFGYAKELIDAEYADGNYQISKSRDKYGKVNYVLGFQINAKGRVFLDELVAAIEKETWAYRIKLILVGLFGAVSTVILGLVSGLGVEVLKPYLSP